MRMLAIVLSALCVLPLHAMERDQRASNHNERPLGAAVKVLEVTGNFLASLESVTKNLKEQDALKVSTLKKMLDAADSRWQLGIVYTAERVVKVAPGFAIPYLQRVAGTFHAQGPKFIHFLVEQNKEKKSLSDLLQSVRHGARYLAPNRDAFNAFLSTHETTINNGLNDYHPLLPAVGAGIRAMHASLAAREQNVQRSEPCQSDQASDYSAESSIFDELRFMRSLLAYIQPNTNDPEDDARDVYAEYDRIGKEVTSIGLRLHAQDEVDVFYDAQDEPNIHMGSLSELQDSIDAQDHYEALYWAKDDQCIQSSNNTGMSWWCS